MRGAVRSAEGGAAVEVDRLAGDPGGLLRGEVDAAEADVFGRAGPAGGDVLGQRVDRARVLGLHEAERERVGGDAEARVLHREMAHERDRAALARGVRRHTDLETGDARARRDGDDTAEA